MMTSRISPAPNSETIEMTLQMIEGNFSPIRRDSKKLNRHPERGFYKNIHTFRESFHHMFSA